MSVENLMHPKKCNCGSCCNCSPKTYGPLPTLENNTELLKQLIVRIAEVMQTGEEKTQLTAPQQASPANLDKLIYEHTGFNVNQADDALSIKGIKSLLNAVLSAAPTAPVKPQFPTMLRKMWSGGEVQAWIDENWTAAHAEDGLKNVLEKFLSDLKDMQDAYGEEPFNSYRFTEFIDEASRALITSTQAQLVFTPPIEPQDALRDTLEAAISRIKAHKHTSISKENSVEYGAFNEALIVAAKECQDLIPSTKVPFKP